MKVSAYIVYDLKVFRSLDLTNKDRSIGRREERERERSVSNVDIKYDTVINTNKL